MLTKPQEKKLRKSFKLYVDGRKGCLTIFDKKTGLYKGSISRSEAYIIPQFVYDLQVNDIKELCDTGWQSEHQPQWVSRTIHETYDTFDEAVTRLLEVII